jgi:hypothetical protein
VFKKGGPGPRKLACHRQGSNHLEPRGRYARAHAGHWGAVQATPPGAVRRNQGRPVEYTAYALLQAGTGAQVGGPGSYSSGRGWGVGLSIAALEHTGIRHGAAVGTGSASPLVQHCIRGAERES